MVTSRRLGEPLGRLSVSYEKLVRGQTQPAVDGDTSLTLVGCGYVNREGDQDIRLIDHCVGHEVAVGDIGEICVRGPSVCSGYYRQPESSDGIFNAYAGPDGSGGFLRTGDLGFVDRDNQLYITGRLKDVVIWNGTNHYPQDIELVIEESSSRIRGGRVAVFNVNAGCDIGVFAACEVSLKQPQPDLLDAMALEVRDTVQSLTGIPLAGIIFIAKGTIPRTSSGKIRRSECRNRYLTSCLTILHQWYGYGWQEPISRLMQSAAPQDAAALVV